MRIVIVYGGDGVRRSVEECLGLREPEYQVEMFSTPGAALETIYQPEFLEQGLLLIGFEFASSGISARDLLADLPMPRGRVIRMSVLERLPFELNGHECIRPDVREIRQAVKRAEA